MFTHKLAAIKAAAEKRAEAIKDVALVIEAKVSATGATYGSVGKAQIAEALHDERDFAVVYPVAFSEGLVPAVGEVELFHNVSVFFRAGGG